MKRERSSYGTALLSLGAFMVLLVPIAHSQPVATSGLPERAQIIEYKQISPSETYVSGFVGYTFEGALADVNVGGNSMPDRNLADSVVYGGKLGHFFGNRLDWLGVEMEAHNTTPHAEQHGQTPGSHLRVTTLAFNLIGRLDFACKMKTKRTEMRTEKQPGPGATERNVRYETRYEREFCRLQPYGGVGLGIFFANLSNIDGRNISSSDNAVPGLNLLGGVRYFFTEHVALFGEYKYNRATFDFGNGAGFASIKTDFHNNHLVGGLSYHF